MPMTFLLALGLERTQDGTYTSSRNTAVIARFLSKDTKFRMRFKLPFGLTERCSQSPSKNLKYHQLRISWLEQEISTQLFLSLSLFGKSCKRSSKLSSISTMACASISQFSAAVKGQKDI